MIGIGFLPLAWPDGAGSLGPADPSGQLSVADRLAVGDAASSAQTSFWKSVPSRPSGTSKARRSRAKYSSSWVAASLEHAGRAPGPTGGGALASFGQPHADQTGLRRSRARAVRPGCPWAW